MAGNDTTAPCSVRTSSREARGCSEAVRAAGSGYRGEARKRDLLSSAHRIFFPLLTRGSRPTAKFLTSTPEVSDRSRRKPTSFLSISRGVQRLGAPAGQWEPSWGTVTDLYGSRGE